MNVLEVNQMMKLTQIYGSDKNNDSADNIAHLASSLHADQSWTI